MIITGKKVFNIIYVINLIFQVIFIVSSWVMGKRIDFGYILLAVTSIILTTIVFSVINKNEKNDVK